MDHGKHPDQSPGPLSVDRMEFAKNCTKLINEAIRLKRLITVTKDGEPYAIFKPL